MAEPPGGDPACWLDRVCEECGRLMEGDVTHHCPVPPVGAKDSSAAVDQGVSISSNVGIRDQGVGNGSGQVVAGPGQ